MDDKPDAPRLWPRIAVPLGCAVGVLIVLVSAVGAKETCSSAVATVETPDGVVVACDLVGWLGALSIVVLVAGALTAIFGACRRSWLAPVAMLFGVAAVVALVLGAFSSTGLS